MRAWLISVWDSFRTSFWFVPTLMTLVALALGAAMPQVDRRFEGWIVANLPWVTTTPESAQTMLTSIASTMVTVAGVVLSITIVALSITTAQYGSRLLRTFMTDMTTQVAIGTFIASSLYCLLVLQDVRIAEGRIFVPHVSVMLGVFSVIVSLSVLIYFIHHVALEIQANNVVQAVGRDLNASIDRLYPETVGHEPRVERNGQQAAEHRRRLGEHFELVRSAHEGYIEAIDLKTVMSLTCEKDLVIELLCRPGSFTTHQLPLAKIWPADAFEERFAAVLNSALIVGPRRTPRQDVEYAISELVEVAVRSLSPAVNNPFTAMACADRLGASLCRLAGRDIPSPDRRDQQGRLRILAEPLTFPQLLRASFEQIRYYARTNPDVTVHLLEVLAFVAGQARRRGDRDAVRQEAEVIVESAQSALPDECDRERVRDAGRSVLNVLAEDDPTLRLERAGEALPPRTLT